MESSAPALNPVVSPPTVTSRNEKKKERKKMKRKLARREAAERERQQEENQLNDLEEQKKMKEEYEAEEERNNAAIKLFEERERIWLEESEKRKRELEAQEEEFRLLKSTCEKGNELILSDGDEEWERSEEGPPEIIWKGNEIIIRKKKVKVSKEDSSQKQETDRPISNPFPPECESLTTNHSQTLENFATIVPNFGTEQDKEHCPFHLKTGACRFGQQCSRVHFYPEKSNTILIKNMYNGPGIAWEQDEGLEYTDEEVERFFGEFYEDVHTELIKNGELINFKVCRNGSFHLRGNVYAHYKSLHSSELAFHAINGRFFAGKQMWCEFVNVTRWKVAICGEFMKSRYKNCSHGVACNFIHCFRNPFGDYEWANWDKPPPLFWVQKMNSLFGSTNVTKATYDRKRYDSSPQKSSLRKKHGKRVDKHQSVKKEKY